MTLVLIALVLLCAFIIYLSYSERKKLINTIIAKNQQELFMLNSEDVKPKIKISKPLSDETEAIIEELRR